MSFGAGKWEEVRIVNNIFTPNFGGKTRNSSQKSPCALSNRKIVQKWVKMAFFVANFYIGYVFRHEESEFEVYFEIGSRSNGVSAHAQ